MTERMAAIRANDPVMLGLLLRVGQKTVLNPLAVAARQAAHDLMAYAREFGFTPAARAGVSTIEAPKSSPIIRFHSSRA
jgi:phage terminase small subunit